MISNEEEKKEFFDQLYTIGEMGAYGYEQLLKYPYATIHYYYPIEKLYEMVKGRTSVIGRARVDNNGNHLLDAIALTNDDKEVFMPLLKMAADEVYRKIEPYMPKDYKAYFFNIDSSYFTKFNKAVHYIVERPSWVLPNAESSTDTAIEECIVLYAIFKWFLLVYPEEASVYLEEFNNKAMDLRMLIGEHNIMSVNSHPM